MKIFVFMILILITQASVADNKNKEYGMLYMQTVMIQRTMKFCADQIPSYSRYLSKELPFWEDSQKHKISQGKLYFDKINKRNDENPTKTFEKKIDSAVAQLKMKNNIQIKKACKQSIKKIRSHYLKNQKR